MVVAQVAGKHIRVIENLGLALLLRGQRLLVPLVGEEQAHTFPLKPTGESWLNTSNTIMCRVFSSKRIKSIMSCPASVGAPEALRASSISWPMVFPVSIGKASLLIQPPEGVEMLLPVVRVDVGVFDRVATVNHHAVAHINADVRYRPGAVIGAGEENTVPRFLPRRGDTMAHWL